VLLSEGREGRRELMVSYSILAKAITSCGVELYATRFGNSKFLSSKIISKDNRST
jgi:hypothetical protein